MGYTDAQNLLAEAQAVTAAAATTDYINLGPYGAQIDVDAGINTNTSINLGNSAKALYCVVTCMTTMDDTGDDSTLEFKLQTDDNTSFSSPADVIVVGTFPATSPAGTRYWKQLPADVDYQQYLRGYFTPSGGNLSAGAFTVEITLDAPKWKPGVQARSYSQGTA